MRNYSNLFSLSWENFEKVIQSMDWYYDYSDDHFVWERESNKMGWLCYAFSELEKQDQKRAVEIWNAYAPKNRKKTVNFEVL